MCKCIIGLTHVFFVLVYMRVCVRAFGEGLWADKCVSCACLRVWFSRWGDARIHQSEHRMAIMRYVLFDLLLCRSLFIYIGHFCTFLLIHSFVGLFPFISVTFLCLFWFTLSQVFFHLYLSLFYVSFDLLCRRSFSIYMCHFSTSLLIYSFAGLFPFILVTFVCLFWLLWDYFVGLFWSICAFFVRLFLCTRL